MLKICKILFLNILLFLVTNEIWMAQPGDRKIALSSRAQSLAKQDLSDNESFIALVEDVKSLIQGVKILNNVSLLVSQLQASEHKTEKKKISIAKKIVRELSRAGICVYEKIIRFVVEKEDLLLARALFTLGLPFRSDQIHLELEALSKIVEISNEKLKVLHYLKANNDLLRGSLTGKSEECRRALQAGACVNVRSANNNLQTPLHQAVGCKHELWNEELIDILIAADAYVNAQDYNGYTPLHLILDEFGNRCLNKNFEQNKSRCKSIIKKLLHARARVSIQDRDGQTPLDLAISFKCKDLLQNGEKKTPLHSERASLSNQTSNADVESLYDLETLSDGDSKDFFDKLKEEIKAVLRARFEGLEQSKKLKKYEQLLNSAIEQGKLPLVQALVESGAPIDIEKFEEQKPKNNKVKKYLQANVNLYNCAKYNDEKGVIEALAAGAYVDLREAFYYDTPLFQAALLERTTIVPILIKAKADVNAQNKDGNTPLHAAIIGFHGEVVIDQLFAAGAKKDIKNKQDQTYVDLIKRFGHEKYYAKTVLESAWSFISSLWLS